MDPASHYPEPISNALSRGAQQSAQLASIVVAAAQVYAQYRAHRERQQAARDEQAARMLREQDRAAFQQARTGWAPAHDPRWLAQAGLLQAASVWGAAAPYADADPVAASALRKCEERLRALHPYAMARYDRLRGDGMNPVEAMSEAMPLFTREPNVRTGEPAAERSSLDVSAGEPPPSTVDEWTDRVTAARRDTRTAEAARAQAAADRTAAQVAAESFPCTAADAVAVAASSDLQQTAQPPVRPLATRTRRPGPST